MPSPSGAFAWLLDKEWRELAASRAWWVLLLAMGPLVGVSFISAATTYAEASGLNGTAAGVGEAFSPLIGIWAPTFSSCELAAAFLLPFVGIRLVAGDRQSGALMLELQHRLSALARMAAKAIVLLGAWAVASIAPLLAVALWRSYGGHVYVPELLAVLLGHVLNAGLTIALAAAAAAVTEHPSTAAIVTLTVTVGTWVVSFIAAVHGGWWERIAGYTPTAMVARFQHGLVEADMVVIAMSLVATGLVVAAVWTRLGVPVARRLGESGAVVLVATAAIAISSGVATATWDLSENRANSFSRAEESALRRIRTPLRIEAHLAPEDPRRVDLERRALSKLRRVVPAVEVRYVSATSVGLFEQTASHYGEIWYELGGHREMSRATNSEGVLETIFTLAGTGPDARVVDPPYRGYPLPVAPRGAGLVFYVAWPAVVLGGAFLSNRRRL